MGDDGSFYISKSNIMKDSNTKKPLNNKSKDANDLEKIRPTSSSKASKSSKKTAYKPENQFDMTLGRLTVKVLRTLHKLGR